MWVGLCPFHHHCSLVLFQFSAQIVASGRTRVASNRSHFVVVRVVDLMGCFCLFHFPALHAYQRAHIALSASVRSRRAIRSHQRREAIQQASGRLYCDWNWAHRCWYLPLNLVAARRGRHTLRCDFASQLSSKGAPKLESLGRPSFGSRRCRFVHPQFVYQSRHYRSSSDRRRDQLFQMVRCARAW